MANAYMMTQLFTRLTFNTNNWNVPSGHEWEKSNQGKTNIPYENQYGFGHEEWLFNTRYLINGYQYGYLRGLRNYNAPNNEVEIVYLYSVYNKKGIRRVYYLGYITNVELLDEDWGKLPKVVVKTYQKFSEATKAEVEASGGDSKALVKDEFIPVIRFKPENAFLLDEPIFIENFPLDKYKRFQPYKLTEAIKAMFEEGKPNDVKISFKFAAGKASQTDRFNRSIKSSSKEIIKFHSKIIDGLEAFLQPKYSIVKKNLSIEKTRFKGNIADVVTKEPDSSISIYEVKTSLIARKNIREAIAQLLDYASHCENKKIKCLYIVTPCKLREVEKIFLNALKKVIHYNIIYIEYNELLNPHFVIYE